MVADVFFACTTIEEGAETGEKKGGRFLYVALLVSVFLLRLGQEKKKKSGEGGKEKKGPYRARDHRRAISASQKLWRKKEEGGGGDKERKLGGRSSFFNLGRKKRTQ